ncbi:MAG: phenylalanine--tRNA ligase subunit beta [Bacteroidales bacterium]|nr:phenylalanine--tRNA ligase subunit beta [Bacteroidales bacterium]
MNVSYNWLKRYINLDLTPEKVSETLTSIGLEVGSVETVQTIKGGLEGLVVGEVLTCEAHPNSDHLHKTTVNVGSGEPLPIVCGAPNVAAGQKVIVATIGTVLYDGDKEFVIKASKLRGEPSMGMICAEDEIGVGTDHSGIIVLPDSVPVGTLAKDYYNVENDTVFEVDITPNRIDAASHYGVARDLAAALSLTRDDIKLTRPSVDAFSIDDNSLPIIVTVENTDACPRYAGVTINNIEIKESPEWLQKALRSIGLSPINNVVDVTNYVLFALGQPLHAFDADKIKGAHIRVRNCAEGTKFVTLDGKERSLHPDDLMICNEDEPMCIGGVFGGQDSGVTENTKRIFLESAYFNPVCIRKTARRQQLNTDASFRFERGIDPNNTIYALKYAALLVKEVAGGTISSDIVDICSRQFDPFRVEFNIDRCNRLIGKQLPTETIKKILSNLEIKIDKENGSNLTLLVPQYRVDVTREADVVEDILRIYGYNNVELPDCMRAVHVVGQKPDKGKMLDSIAAMLNSVGFQEIMCNTLTKSAYYNELTTFPKEQTVELANPLSTDLNGLRQTLLFGALESAQHNRNRKCADLKLFEIGNCHSFKGGDKADLKNYTDQQRISLLMTGLRNEANWCTQAQEVTFFDLKRTVFNVIEKLGIKFNSIEEQYISNDIYSEGLTLVIDKSKTLATFGAVSAKLLKQFDIDVPVYFGEMNFDVLYEKSARQNKIFFTELPKYPEVKRDLALLINNDVTFGQIKQIAQRTEKKLLKRISLFDVYEGKNLPEGKKSYAVSFYLQDETQTLKDAQIEKIMDALTNNFKRELNAELR